jgi:hypothetical protein
MSRFRDFLSDTLLVAGLILFIVATVQPFLTSQDLVGTDSFGMPLILPFSRACFFSFKADYYEGR